jgi:hypothetical protein
MEARRHHTNHSPRRQAMQTFLSVHPDEITEALSTFDRLISKGHLSGLCPQGAFARFLNSQHILLKASPPTPRRPVIN